ncbi:MAG TPA: transaldolase, partial [Elusimicrobiota bacterium]|nr:transaldolase [Elusimicrobiota bacterium]
DQGVRGVTSNPTIFEKAMTSGHAYDADMARLQSQGKPASEVFETLAIDDIQRACDAFKPVYESSHGADGYVSLEVNPHLARDTQATLRDARRLFRAVARPNVMIKIPGTREGLPAIEQALADGININVTLIFSLARYQEVLEAWLGGLERLARAGQGLASVASVASFFVSRVDSLIDPQLEKTGATALRGKAAIANAQKAYDIFLAMKSGARWQALAAQGAQIQRPLWASTSTKNPAYRDVVYVEELVGAETVNTMPLATIDAFRDHGQPKATLPAPAGTADGALQQLSQAGIDMDAVTRRLEEEGLLAFEKSYDSLIGSLEQKKEALKV